MNKDNIGLISKTGLPLQLQTIFRHQDTGKNKGLLMSLFQTQQQIHFHNRKNFHNNWCWCFHRSTCCWTNSVCY